MGEIVNEGVTPPHKCSQYSAPGRPTYGVNYGTVWLCECGKYWQFYEQPVVDLEGDYYGTEDRWRESIDAEGRIQVYAYVPRDKYLSYKTLWPKCKDHGFVSWNHWHRELIIREPSIYR